MEISGNHAQFVVQTGPYVKLNEAHVLLGCPATASERKDCEIAEYVEQYQGMATNYILRW